jgi:hypothetical protein
MEEKRDEFIFNTCKYVASIILEQEHEVYCKIFDKDKNKLNVLQTEKIKSTLIKIYERKFNTMHCDILDKKELPSEFIKLTTYFNHSKLCLIHTLFPICNDVHTNFNRKELNITDINTYTESLSKSINKLLNENYYDILENLVKNINKYPDDLINDNEYNKTRHPFVIKIET